MVAMEKENKGRDQETLGKKHNRTWYLIRYDR
jgi:hypothetical protein